MLKKRQKIVNKTTLHDGGDLIKQNAASLTNNPEHNSLILGVYQISLKTKKNINFIILDQDKKNLCT